MRLAFAQLRSVIGDVEGNLHRLIDAASAQSRHFDVLITPELFLLGYPPRDLLTDSKRLIEAQEQALRTLEGWSKQHQKILIVGHTSRVDQSSRNYNSASCIFDGRVQHTVHKSRLPSYDVFEDERFFVSAADEQDNCVDTPLGKIHVSICEDMWDAPLAFGEQDVRRYRRPSPLRFKGRKPDLFINISASPFGLNKAAYRHDLASAHAQRLATPFAYVNATGGQDDVIFDGGSFLALPYDDGTSKILRCPPFTDDVFVLDSTKASCGFATPQSLSRWEELERALVMGIKDFVHGSGFERAILGLSGGIDSALVAYLATQALGKDNISLIYLPTKNSSALSEKISRDVAKSLNAHLRVIPLSSNFEALADGLNISLVSLAAENLQARLRGTALMTLANDEKRLLLACSNKSELAVGYATIYGDMCGALAPIGDLYKTEVYGLAHHINRNKLVFSNELLLRPPTAELREHQKDEDSLPSYDRLDALLFQLIERQGELRGGFEAWDRFFGRSGRTAEIQQMFTNSEFKRRQAPPVLKCHQRSFGYGWHQPIIRKKR